MKQLSLKEKARLYDEAINAIRKCETDKYGCIIGIKPSDLFHELAESEDERIRKGLIEGFQQYDEEECWRNIEYLKIKDILTWLKKQGEQKLVEAFEPKFKVGDWCIDNEDGTIFQIVKVLDNTYIYRTNEGKEYSCTHYSLENDARLWTTSDTRDGDALATKKGNPFIYDKNRYNNGLAYYYVGLVNKELILKNPHNMLTHFGELSSAFPATKEQRNQLEKAMADAGYMWDAEKKELRKIK